MKLLTTQQFYELLVNGIEQQRRGGAHDPEPVFKLFTPDGVCT